MQTRTAQRWPQSPTAVLSAATAAAAAVALGLSLVGCDDARYTEAFLPEGDITRIRILSDQGEVSLVSGSAVRVERTIRAPEGALALSHRVEPSPEQGGGETLVLEARCTLWVPCAVDMLVEVPAGVSVEVVLGTGAIWASDITSLAAEVRRGSLSAEVEASLTAQVGVGQVTATLTSAQAAATIAVGQGDVDVHILPGLWRLTADAAALHVSEEVLPAEPGEAAAAAGRLELIAPAGRVSVFTGPVPQG